MAQPKSSTSTGLPQSLWIALFHAWTWRMAWRDSRTQRKRLAIFSLSIVSGITALVAIHALKASVETGIETQAKALLGSDLQITSRQPFTTKATSSITSQVSQVSREVSISSMLFFPNVNAARLVQIRGMSSGYPFYGSIETSPPQAWQELSTSSGIILEPSLLEQFQVKVGDKVRLGSTELVILGTVTKAAPTTNRFVSFAPTAYVRLTDLEQAGLLGTSSLASYHLHVKVQAAAQIKPIRDEFAGLGWRFETPESRRDSLGKTLDNFQRFLGLIAMAALVLGAIGVAGAVHSHVSRRIPTVAILRCLGCPGNLAFAIYLAQAMVLALIGALIGMALGTFLYVLILGMFKDSLPVPISDDLPWLVIARTSVIGLAICSGFALLPLMGIRRISPGTTLREDATEGSRLGWIPVLIVYLLLGALIFGLAFLNGANNWKIALSQTAGLVVAFLTLAGIAKGLTWLARKSLRPTWPYLLRQGISNLYRPRNQTLLFLLSLGLGTFLLVTILLARNLLTERINVAKIPDSPSLYLVDVQSDQVEGVKSLLAEQNLPVLEVAPIVTMRIQSVKGVPVAELEKEKGIPKWLLQREFRSSYRSQLNKTEEITSGEWIDHVSDSNAPVPLSLEAETAKDLRAGLGDEIVVDVQGIPIKTKVTSIRKVDWGHFNLNFFMLFPPGVLEAAPGFSVITARVPEGQSSGPLQRSLVESFPNVSAIDLELVLSTVRSLLDRIGQVIEVLALFTVFAGIPILIGTLLNGRDQRLRESVLLRTLGASTRQVQVILMIEYATLGILAALSGIVLAVTANAVLAVYVFQASPWPSSTLLATAGGIVTALSVGTGLLLSRGVCNHPPLEILRKTA